MATAQVLARWGKAVSQWPQLGLLALVRGYRFFLKPWLGNACRFEPTCSSYALEALTKHGATAGGALTVYRLVRCQPWCRGGHDPVPATHLFSRLMADPLPSAATSSKEKTAS